jgi:hypothetical protein
VEGKLENKVHRILRCIVLFSLNLSQRQSYRITHTQYKYIYIYLTTEPHYKKHNMYSYTSPHFFLNERLECRVEEVEDIRIVHNVDLFDPSRNRALDRVQSRII